MPFRGTRLTQLACLAAWAALGAGGPAAAQGDARSALIEQGIHWQSLGRLELAEASWRKLLSADPQSADGLYGMSQVELARGNIEAARGWIARLRAAHPGDARAVALEARTRQPGAPTTDLQAARSAARAGRTAEALQMYRAIFGNRPPPEPLALEFYQLLGGSPQGWDEAHQGLEQLVRNKPDRPDYRLALAQLQTYREPTRRQGIRSLVDLSKQPTTAAAARASWRQALLWLDARAADAALYRDYLATQSDPALAQRLERLAATRPELAAPGPADPLRLGFAALDRGDLPNAERRFQEALRLRPGNTDALGGLGVVRLRQQRFAQAQELLARASKAGGRQWASALRSASYWDLFDQARAARDRNDSEAARQLLERAVQLDPREAAGRQALADLQRDTADALYARALLAAHDGDGAAGLQYLDRIPAASRTPEMMQLQRRLWVQDQVRQAGELARQGQAEAARELLARTESATAGDLPPEVLGPLALAHADAGDTARALSFSRRLVESGPEPSVADQLLHASLLFKANRDAELAALLDRLQTADMTAAQRSDFQNLRAGHDARQDHARQAAADRTPLLTAGTVYRHRGGEPGLGRLTDVQTPIEARIPFGEGRITVGVTPTVLHAGTLAPDQASASRFGSGAPAAQLQAIGAVAPPGAQTARGVGLSAGYESTSFNASLGTTPIGFARTSLVGNITYSGNLTDKLSLKADLSRRPVTDSLLSFAGTRDPRTGVEWGGVVATGGRLDLARDVGSYGIYGYGSAHSITGKNVASNNRYELGAGAYIPILRSASASLTVGMNLDLLSYDKNLSQFTYGQGGYFSPQRYASLTLPLDWSERDQRMSWRLNASIGVQSFREDPVRYLAADGTLSSTVPGTRRTGLAYNVAAIVEYQVAPQLYLGGALGFNNARDYRQVTANAYLRYVFGGPGSQNAPAGRTRLRPFSSPYTPLL